MALEKRRAAGAGGATSAWLVHWVVLTETALGGAALLAGELRERPRGWVWLRAVGLLLLVLAPQPLLLILPWTELARTLGLPLAGLEGFRALALWCSATAGAGLVGDAVLRMVRSQADWRRAFAAEIDFAQL